MVKKKEVYRNIVFKFLVEVRRVQRVKKLLHLSDKNNPEKFFTKK